MMFHDTPDPRSEPVARPLAPSTPVGSAPAFDDEMDTLPVLAAPEMIHRWLDGEAVPAAELATPEVAPFAALWADINAETARRRLMAAPAGLEAAVLANLQLPVVLDD